jgi:putative transcription factor
MSPRQAVTECEMCGSKTSIRRHLVSGTTMQLGACCSKFGEAMDQPATPGTQAAVTQNLERRQTRMQGRDVYQEETWDLVPNFGAVIRQAREKKGWTHDELGNKVSARVPQMKQIESGHLRPSDVMAKKFQQALGITLLEKMEKGPAKVVGQSNAPKAGLTIGDILKDAMNKQ